MGHKFASVVVGRGTTVEFEFEDSRRFVKDMLCKRNHVVNGRVRKGGKYFELSNGDRVYADEVWKEMEQCEAMLS